MEQPDYKKQYLEEVYEKLTLLGKKADDTLGTFLVKNRQTGKIAVAKYVDASVLPVYEKLAKINNRHIEKVYQCACGRKSEFDGKEEALVITEYISGISLREYMENNGLLQEEAVCNLVGQLLEILQVVHAQGIVHRDINPDNIMISGDGVLKLIDFGIAREMKAGKNQDTTILGTVGYAAPEQFGFMQTDERTDIYAVGVLMNKMLTGYFPGEQLYAKEPMRKVICRCTAMDLRQRYLNVNEVAGELAKVMSIPTQTCTDFYSTQQNVTHDKKFVVSWLPGFRTGVVWKNVVAIIGYFFMVVYTVVSMTECAVTWQSFVLETTALFLYIWLATLLSANIANWDRRVPICRELPKAVRITVRVILWIVLFYAGASLEGYVRYDMLGIPKA